MKVRMFRTSTCSAQRLAWRGGLRMCFLVLQCGPPGQYCASFLFLVIVFGLSRNQRLVHVPAGCRMQQWMMSIDKRSCLSRATRRCACRKRPHTPESVLPMARYRYQAGGVGVIARLLVGDPEDAAARSVILAALSALHGVCRNSERNRDAFVYTNMEQVRLRYGTGMYHVHICRHWANLGLASARCSGEADTGLGSRIQAAQDGDRYAQTGHLDEGGEGNRERMWAE